MRLYYAPDEGDENDRRRVPCGRCGRRAEHTQAGAIEQAEARRQVLAAVATLSTTQRETVTLYYLNGYRLEEVARILEVPGS
jgi:DNA-directed RNA polymerase specialized sigma24 family protein